MAVSTFAYSVVSFLPFDLTSSPVLGVCLRLFFGFLLFSPTTLQHTGEDQSGQLLLTKVKQMLIVRHNLLEQKNFRVTLDNLWSQFIKSIDGMPQLCRSAERMHSESQDAAGVGSDQGTPGKTRRKNNHSIAEKLNEKKRIVRLHRTASTIRQNLDFDLGDLKAKQDEKKSLPAAKKKKMNFRRSITQVIPGALAHLSKEKGSLGLGASIESLISGNNATTQKSQRKESLTGVVRSRSYHWN